MGTVVEITVSHRSEELARAAIREALGEFQRIDALMSGYKAGSELSGINKTGSGAKVPVEGEVFTVIRDAVAISGDSGGVFDPAIWPVSQLWGFDHGWMIPIPELLEKKTEACGIRQADT